MSFLSRLYRAKFDPSYRSFDRHYSRKVYRCKIMSAYCLSHRLFQETKVVHKQKDKFSDFYFSGLPHVEFTGCVPEYVGYYPSTPIRPNQSFLNWLKNSRFIYDPIIQKDVLTSTRINLTSGFDTQLPILKEYASQNYTGYTADDFMNILEQEDFPWLKLPKMEFPSVSDLEKVFIKTDANSGYYTSKFFGTKKEQSALPSLEIAKQIFESLDKKKFNYTGLWSLYGRSKDVKANDSDTKQLETRCVWVPEHALVLLGGLIVQKFTWHLQSVSQNCLFIGKSFKASEVNWLFQNSSMSDFMARCDWAHFDANVSPAEVLAALQIIQKCYGESKHCIRYFDLMYNTLVYKNLVVPPGFVYKFSKGLPSGHPFTSLVGTLINYIRWVVILQQIYGVGKVASSCSAAFSGDDTILFLESNYNLLHIDDIIHSCSKSWKCDSVLETLVPSRKQDDTTRIHFLKRAPYSGGVIGWSLKSSLRKFSYPKKNTFSLDEQIEWFFNLVNTAPGNNYLSMILYEYLSYMIRQTYTERSSVEARLHYLKERFLHCRAEGYSLQQPDLLSLITGSRSLLSSHSINLSGKKSVISCCKRMNTLSSFGGSLSNLCLGFILGGKDYLYDVYNQANPNFSSFLSERGIRDYDMDVISKVCSAKHVNSLFKALSIVHDIKLEGILKKYRIAPNFSIFLTRKLRRIYKIDSYYQKDLELFMKFTSSEKEKKIDTSLVDWGWPP